MQETRKTADPTHTLANLPAQPISAEVLIEKYAKGDERSVADVHQRVARALAAGRAARAARALGGALRRRRCDAGLRAGRAHPVGRRHRPVGHADQLLRAAGGRLDRAGRRRPPRHLHRADRGRRDHAPRRRRRLRLLAHPPARRLGGQHAEQRLGPGELHARVRPLLRDGRERRRAARRADGRAALRPPGHRGVHPRQGRRRPEELQHLGRRDRRLHGGRAGRRRGRAGAPRRARRGAEGRRRLPGAQASGDGLWVYRKLRGARAVGPDHAVAPTTTPSPACCSSTTSTATTTCRTARPSPAPTPAASSRCRPTAAAASARST